MPVDIDAAVISNTRLSEEFNVVALAAPQIAATARPGQFVMIKTNEGTDPLLRRPFSIFQVLRDATGRATGLTILNKRVGRGTVRLFDASAGRHFACLGPLGQPFMPVDPPARAWMVAGGVGLAPFFTLAESLRARGTAVTLFYGARRAVDLFFVEEFTRLGARVIISTEDGSRGTPGLITAPLGEALSGGAADVHLYACGPTPMMQAVARLADAHGCPCDVSLEQIMGCGLGGCYSCVVGVQTERGTPHFVRSCIEGPVFDSRRIAWGALGH